MTDMTVANTILQQFGGGRALAMIGATGKYAAVGGENFLQIKFKAGAKNKANRVRIELTERDDYTVTFERVWGSNIKEISKHEMIYCDMLMDLFEQETAVFLTYNPRK